MMGRRCRFADEVIDCGQSSSIAVMTPHFGLFSVSFHGNAMSAMSSFFPQFQR